MKKEDITKVQELEKKLQYNERLKTVTNKINSVSNIDEIFIRLISDILGLFDAERITIYAIDPMRNELYSKHLVGAEIKRIRLPISASSLAGYVAYTLETINIPDVYDTAMLNSMNPRLTFDSNWDKKTGFRTKQILATPIRFENRLFGVIQLINKKEEEAFSKDDEKNIVEIARILGIAFRNQSKMLTTRFNYLVMQNIITEEELKRAIIAARERKKEIEVVLMEEFKVQKKDIGAALSQSYGYKFIEYSDKYFIPRDIAKGLNLTYLKNANWIPISATGGKVVIAIDSPNDMKISEIKGLIKADDYEFNIALKEDISKFINSLEKDTEYAAKPTSSVSDILSELEIREEDDADRTDSNLDENAGAIVRLANKIIIDAYEKGASDIHIEPSKMKKKVDIRYRVDGACMRHIEIPYSHNNALVSRLKIMSSLDIAERRMPQDGKIKFTYKDKQIELRVATLPTVGGEAVVMRILAASEPMPLNALRLSERNLTELKSIVSKPYGLVLVVGPTGSGKTTTLHSALGHINVPETKIWTAEDPVEITQYGLCQVEVKPKIKFDFARAMRAFLRADPDVIMVGEMRDHETAATGIEASLTGHLVFSTLHTNSAPETITRLIDMGLDPFNFADALLGVLAQRLVRTLCKDCKQPYRPAKDEFDELVEAYGRQAFPELGVTYDDKFTLYKAKGCNKCNNTGYRGRAGIHELLVGTTPIKKLIQKKALMEVIREQAIVDGMKTLFQDGVDKVIQGLTDIKQVRRVCM
ncbi:GspE/PulE family protein [Candidatus Magnetobacterium casense]|uniref:GspE/PulE family protein n=1 Tax=Candidatus Magnetobacterium casense TaxID=1455061 RepID=A0ABS6S047_9BACT|nr:GspE/PulE family protein [Candidatus Magnetobacterium casensis]MBV6342240.1 GspE/PulE family protein [Candidatus Magnetobacterium casensis]